MTESFRARFASWLGESNWGDADKKEFLTSGLVVFDTNALLTLYKIDPGARNQVIDVLESIKGRFWIPHQVGLEFARNRDKTVQGRYAEITSARDLAKRTEKKVITAIEEAIETLIDVRTRSLSQREWERESFGLSTDDLNKKFDGILEPVIAELDKMKKEQDSSIKRIQDHDPVLDKLDPILTGRVGDPYPPSKLRSLVEEAENFRFPNEMPPGYKDKDKPTMLGRAGDFILWRQLLDKVESDKGTTKVILVTNDIKTDWWQIDAAGNPTHPRPELLQEMRDHGNSGLLVLTLANFMADVRDHLSAQVSTDTVKQLQKAEPLIDPEGPPSILEDLYRTSPVEFEQFTYRLLLQAGFEPINKKGFHGRDTGLDFAMIRTSRNGARVSYGIEVKQSVSRSTYRLVTSRLAIAMEEHGLERGLIITLSPINPALLREASDRNIEFLSAPDLIQLVGRLRRSGSLHDASGDEL